MIFFAMQWRSSIRLAWRRRHGQNSDESDEKTQMNQFIEDTNPDQISLITEDAGTRERREMLIGFVGIWGYRVYKVCSVYRLDRVYRVHRVYRVCREFFLGFVVSAGFSLWRKRV